MTDFTSDLIYRNESGALNESISDIFGKALEYEYDQDNFTWYIGERMRLDPSVNPFRSMKDPNERNDPKYYGGEDWVTGTFDNGGVHSNSGVYNYWFYLLVEGESGVNEEGYAYDVPPIGWDKALQIVFSNQVGYLTQNSTFYDAMNGSLEATIDLYGNGEEYATVLEAWRTVGLYPGINALDLSIDLRKEEYNFCPGEEEGFQITITNMGENTIAAGQNIEVGFLQSPLDTVKETIQLTSELAVFESLDYDFVTFPDSDQVGPVDVFVLNDQLTPLNNRTSAYINYSDVLGVDLELVEFSLRIPSGECQFPNFVLYDYSVYNAGCESPGFGDTLKFILTTDEGTQIINRRLFSELPAGGFSGGLSFINEFIEFSPRTEEVEVTLVYAADTDPSNQTLTFPLDLNESLIDGYEESFDQVKSFHYRLETDRDSYDSLATIDGNNVLVIAGTRSDDFFRPCGEEADFIASNSTSGINFCIDARDMEEPVFAFRLKKSNSGIALDGVDDNFTSLCSGYYRRRTI